PVGDTKELQAIREVFADKTPKIASTKSLTGHALGAAGVNEAIYSLLMVENNFIAPSINIDDLDPDAEGMPIVTECIDNVTLNRVMSNSFGFGGTNASLVFEKFKQ
ncbi:MAG: beta-ketoacyl-ACP synthase I, partial [Gammaproteobacteria bacterium]|nr:beta-ketoacyl-ACP synthase I [Gammaproteobacteria bacterium]